MIAREVDREQWAADLRTASGELKRKIFSNLSERATDLLKEDMDGVGPIQLSAVEAVRVRLQCFRRKTTLVKSVPVGYLDRGCVVKTNGAGGGHGDCRTDKDMWDSTRPGKCSDTGIRQLS